MDITKSMLAAEEKLDQLNADLGRVAENLLPKLERMRNGANAHEANRHYGNLRWVVENKTARVSDLREHVVKAYNFLVEKAVITH